MANPQKEDGYIPIANEVAEALMKTQLNCYQNRVLWAIWRKTYGYNKVEDWISNSQLAGLTGLHKAHICRTIRQLMDRNIVTKGGNAVTKGGNKIKFNKDYSQWRELPKGARSHRVTKGGNAVTKGGNPELPKGADTKDTITKDNYTKDRVSKDTPAKADKRNPEIGKMIEALKGKIGITDFVDSSIERNMAKHCNDLMARIGKDEFVRRLDGLLKDGFHQKNCNKIRYVYNNIKGWIEPKSNIAIIS